MICTVFATSFTASVESKSAPAVVEVQDEAGNTAVATLSGDIPEEMAMVVVEALVVTAVADAEESKQIPEASQQALLEVYNGLQDGSIQVPFEELDQEKADNLVIRDLFDVSWTDGDGDAYAELLDGENVSLEMTFVVDVAADAQVYVMVYKNDTWQQIQQVTNNGDGTVTCVFNHLCPVAVIVEADETMEVVDIAEEKAEPTQSVEASGQNIGLWAGILAASVIALIAVFAVKKTKKK
jgi:hypothetical protein